MSLVLDILRLPASVVTYGIVPQLDVQSICMLETALRSSKKSNTTHSVPIQVKETAYCEQYGISPLIYSVFHKHGKFIHQYPLVSKKEVFCIQQEYIWIMHQHQDVTCLKINALTNPITRIGRDAMALKMQSSKEPLCKFVVIFRPKEMSYLIKQEFSDTFEDFYVEIMKQSYDCQNFPSSSKDDVPSFNMQKLISDVLSGENGNFKVMSKNSKNRRFTRMKKSSDLQVSPKYSSSKEAVKLSIFIAVSVIALKIIISRR